MAHRITLSMQVQNILQKRIMDGTYKKGEYLPGENALCADLDVSRTTVRDAIRGLEEKGFLQRQHGKGVLVIDESKHVVSDSVRNMVLRGSYSVSEFLETREMIEKQIAGFAAQRATDEEIALMQGTIDAMLRNAEDIDAYVRYDLEFHKTLASASQNRLLIALYDAILPMLQQMISDVVYATGAVELECKYHSRILESIRKRDSETAIIRAAEHDKASEQMFRESIPEGKSMDQILAKKAV